MGINDTTTLSHHPYILCHLLSLAKICFVFVGCVQRGVVEGSGVGSGGCVVLFDVHGSELCCWWLQCSCMADMVCLDCMQKLWSA